MYSMFYFGGNFVSSLICTLKSKEPKNLKTFSKKPRFFPALLYLQVLTMIPMELYTIYRYGAMVDWWYRNGVTPK